MPERGCFRHLSHHASLFSFKTFMMILNQNVSACVGSLGWDTESGEVSCYSRVWRIG